MIFVKISKNLIKSPLKFYLTDFSLQFMAYMPLNPANNNASKMYNRIKMYTVKPV